MDRGWPVGPGSPAQSSTYRAALRPGGAAEAAPEAEPC